MRIAEGHKSLIDEVDFARIAVVDLNRVPPILKACSIMILFDSFLL